MLGHATIQNAGAEVVSRIGNALRQRDGLYAYGAKTPQESDARAALAARKCRLERDPVYRRVTLDDVLAVLERVYKMTPGTARALAMGRRGFLERRLLAREPANKIAAGLFNALRVNDGLRRMVMSAV